MYKKIIACVLACSFFAFNICSVSATVYFPPDFFSYDYINDNFPDGDFSAMHNYVNEYRVNHPDATLFEAYEHYRNSDANGHHGGGGHGGARGYRDSDIIDKTFNYNEIMDYSENFQGTQTNTDYLSYDNRVHVWCDIHDSGTYDIAYDFYITVDGINPISNNGFFYSDRCFDVRYNDKLYHRDGCFWNVKGSLLTFFHHRSRDTQVYKYVDLTPYLPTIDTTPYNYYNVYDTSGQSWRYDTVNNYYVNNADNHTENYIELDITRFPEDDFNKFLKELQNLNYNDAFQFLSLYDLLKNILKTIKELPEGGNIDISDIKLDIPLNDYTSLLQAIQSALVVMSNNLGTLASHSDCLTLIELLSRIENRIQSPINYYGQLSDILSKLDIIIALQSIEVSDDILDNLTDNELSLITTYLETATLLASVLPVEVLNTVLSNIQSIIFSGAAPSDIVINYSGTSVTVLSTSFFSSAGSFVDVCKTLIGIIVLYIWCIRMRSKLTSVL